MTTVIRTRLTLFASLLLLAACGEGADSPLPAGGGEQPAAAPPTDAVLAPPTGPRDLVAFIAAYDARLHRIVGDQTRPFGTVRFYSATSIVADAARSCLYVLDRPKMRSEETKIWRIAPDGSGEVIFRGRDTGDGGPFARPQSLAVDREGRVLVVDATTGLWRLETTGHLQCLFDGRDKPLYKMTAVADLPPQGLLIGTSYLHEISGGRMIDLEHFRGRFEDWSPSPSHVTPALETFLPANHFVNPYDPTGVGNSTGRQIPIRIWKNQGGLYLVDLATREPPIHGVLVNRNPGGEEHETYWRDLSHVFRDTAGRVVLIDAGSKKVREEEVYVSPSRNSPTDRVTESIINGGVFVLHGDGRFEELTFKTAAGDCGPLRRPRGAAQWSEDTYIVADPEMYVAGRGGPGGLMLLGLDGRREARWPLGSPLEPVGVAILRGVAAPATATPTLPLDLNRLAGEHRGGRITAIERVSWERQEGAYPAGHPLAGLAPHWTEASAAVAEGKLRSLYEGARWTIGRDGALRFSAKGVDPESPGTPMIQRGSVTLHAPQAGASASYTRESLFDTQVGSLEARITSPEDGRLTAKVTITLFTKDERLQAAFEQDLAAPEGR